LPIVLSRRLGGELFLIPYDGNDIGSFIGDATRNINAIVGICGVASGFPLNAPFVPVDSAGFIMAYGNGGNISFSPIIFNLATAVPVAHEFRGASVSVCFLISY